MLRAVHSPFVPARDLEQMKQCCPVLPVPSWAASNHGECANYFFFFPFFLAFFLAI